MRQLLTKVASLSSTKDGLTFHWIYSILLNYDLQRHLDDAAYFSWELEILQLTRNIFNSLGPQHISYALRSPLNLNLQATPTSFTSSQDYATSFAIPLLFETRNILAKNSVPHHLQPIQFLAVHPWSSADPRAAHFFRIKVCKTSPTTLADLLLLYGTPNDPQKSPAARLQAVTTEYTDHSKDLLITVSTPIWYEYIDQVLREGCLSVRLSAPSGVKPEVLTPSDLPGIRTSIKLQYAEDCKLAEMASQALSTWQDYKWEMRVIANIKYIYEQLSFVFNINHIPLKPFILNPVWSKLKDRVYQRQYVIPAQLQRSFEETLNESQVRALHTCIYGEGVSLLQGPPGTGKTTTIVSLISALLHSSLKTTGANMTASTCKKRPAAGESVSARPSMAGSKEVQTSKDYREDLVSESRRKSEKASAQCGDSASPWVNDPTFLDAFDRSNVVGSFEDLEDTTSKSQAPTMLVINEAADERARKILICAPSNVAVDEIIKRLTARAENNGGIFDASGSRYNPRLVRFGPNASAELYESTLEGQVQSIVSASGTERQVAEKSVLRSSEVILATLSTAFSWIMASVVDRFDAIIVDEATQCIEPALLIPMQHKCRKLILVGDPAQLPATVFSGVAMRLGLGRSFFQRLVDCGWPMSRLTEQYRMRPEISYFPCVEFYTSGSSTSLPSVLANEADVEDTGALELEDFETAVKDLLDAQALVRFYRTWVPPVWERLPIFRPFVFFSITTSKESRVRQSRVNIEECDLVLQLLELFLLLLQESDVEDVCQDGIGVISPYAEQVHLLSERLKTLPRGPFQQAIEVNTVDAFQGREKDAIIFSTVRSQYGNDLISGKKSKLESQIGFVADARRLNVALTRARKYLWIVGNAQTLATHPLWKRLISHCTAQGCLFQVRDKVILRNYLKAYILNFLQRQTLSVTQTYPKFVKCLQSDVATGAQP